MLPAEKTFLPVEAPPQNSGQLIKKMKTFLALSQQQNYQQVKIIRGGFGIALFQTEQNLLPQIINEAFGCSPKELVKMCKLNGFRVQNPTSGKGKVTLLLSKEKLMETSAEREASQFDWEDEEESDQFPKELEMEDIQKQKEEKVKSGLVKPLFIVNKAQSQGHMGLIDVKKEDASIQVKLKEQQPLIPINKPLPQTGESVASKLQELNPLSLSERINMEKANYERCGRLIQGTIVGLLEAQRGGQLEKEKDKLLSDVVEIYDLLSEGVQNSSNILKLASRKDGLRQQDEEQRQ